MMKFIKEYSQKFDAYQQKHSWLGFPLAVVKRYGDEKVGKQAALITYYGFLSLFPLLLVFLTVVNMVTFGDPELQAKIADQAFRFFPALGTELQENVQAIHSSGWALVIQLLVLLYGARGVGISLQDAFNYVWHSDHDHKTNFVLESLRSFAMIFAVGIGVTAGTVISYLIGRVVTIGFDGAILIVLANLFITIGLFLVVYRLGTSSRIKTYDLILGAFVTALGVLVVQQLGVAVMSHYLPRLEGIYGTFALTLGMLFWIYLQAQVIMYALVITAVKKQHDWPKKLDS